MNEEKEVVFDGVFSDSEGASPAPLSFKGEKPNDQLLQWTGQLFKDQPPVMFGFMYVSFGCPWIDFLDGSMRNLSFSCDNRH